MAVVEDELMAAVEYRAALLLSVAQRCVDLATLDVERDHSLRRFADLSEYTSMVRRLDDALGLSAEIANRCGASWALLGESIQMTGQAMSKGRRRWRGEGLFRDASREPRDEWTATEQTRAEIFSPDADLLPAIRKVAAALIRVRQVSGFWRVR